MAVNPDDVKQDSVNPTDQKQESINPTDVNQGQKDHTVPYSIFKEVKDQVAEFKSKFAELEDEKKVARESKMKEDGKLKELLSEKDSLIDKQLGELQSFKEDYSKEREILFGQMSDSDRDTYSDLSNAKLRVHVNKTGKNISSNTSKATGQRGSLGDFGGYGSWQEFAINDPVGAEKELKKQNKFN